MFEKYVLNTSAMTEGSLIEEPLWFIVTSLLVFLHQTELTKVFQVYLELLEHSVNFLWKYLFLSRRRVMVKLFLKNYKDQR